MKVTFLVSGLSHYRKKFHEHLYLELKKKNVEYEVLVSKSLAVEALNDKDNRVALPYVHNIKSQSFFGGRIHIHGSILRCFRSDLLIVINENKYIFNIIFVFFAIILRQKVFTFGHGVNYHQTVFRNLFSIRYLVNLFSAGMLVYTDKCYREAVKLPFLRYKKIYPIQNCINVSSQAIRFSEKKNRIVFVGTLRTNKRVSLLIDVFREIKQRAPEIELHIIGDGPENDLVKASLEQVAVLHGAVTGIKKETIIKKSKIIFNPGLIGLIAVESLKLGTPIVSSAAVIHSPEVEYLSDGRNAFLINEDGSVNQWVDFLLNLIVDEGTLSQVHENCLNDGQAVSIEKMATNVLRALRL